MLLVVYKYSIDTLNCIKLLIDHKIDLSLKNNNGETALDIARKKNLFEIVDLLETGNINTIYIKPTVNNLRVRENQSIKSAIIAKAGKKDKLLFIERGKFSRLDDKTEGNWLKIQTTSGLTGYVHSAFVGRIKD